MNQYPQQSRIGGAVSSLNRSKEGAVIYSLNNQSLPNRMNYRLGEKFAAGIKQKKKTNNNNVHNIYDNNFSQSNVKPQMNSLMNQDNSMSPAKRSPFSMPGKAVRPPSQGQQQRQIMQM